MNQWQYETIRRCIISGMPAAAQELVNAFDAAVVALNEKNEKTKNDVKETKEAK